MIRATRRDVWTVIADLEDVAEWNPNVESASCGITGVGVGAARTCRLRSGGHIDEIVSEWTPGKGLWFAVGTHGAIRSADMGMTLGDAADGTVVKAIVDYHVAFGPLGPVIDRVALRRQLIRMLDAALVGLAEYMKNWKPSQNNEK